MAGYFLCGEDMAPGAVGPFDTPMAAAAHWELQRDRGDAAVCAHDNTCIFPEHMMPEKYKIFICTPEEDIDPYAKVSHKSELHS